MRMRIVIIPCFVRATAKCFPYVQRNILLHGSGLYGASIHRNRNNERKLYGNDCRKKKDTVKG